jgi:carboxymethylenebutenolidase
LAALLFLDRTSLTLHQLVRSGAMDLETRWVKYGSEGFSGYLCHAMGTKSLPGVVVIQEAWGVDSHIEDVAQRFAGAGYAALAPDLFAKGGERPTPLKTDRMREVRGFMDTAPPTVFMDAAVREAEIAKRPADVAARLRESFGAMAALVMNAPQLVPAVVAAARWLRTACDVTRGRKIGSVGYCLGGGLSAQLAINDPELAAAVIYYGMSPPLDLVPKINAAVLGLYGELDPRVNAGVPAFAEAMKQHGKRFETVTYAGAKHAFANDLRATFDPDATRDAFARTLEFFRVCLKD